MVGHVQRQSATELRERAARSQISIRLDADTADAGSIEDQAVNHRGFAVRTATPPPLPLDSEEAELCARLRDVMAKPPKRQPLEAVAQPDIGVKPAPTPPEVVAERAPLPPLRELPLDEIETGAPGVRGIAWVQRSRRQRLSAAVRSTPAWVMTIGVIGVTLTAALVMAVGMNRSVDLAHRAVSAGSAAVMAVRSAAGL